MKFKRNIQKFITKMYTNVPTAYAYAFCVRYDCNGFTRGYGKQGLHTHNLLLILILFFINLRFIHTKCSYYSKITQIMDFLP